MEFTGERFIPGQGGAIELEHLNRYYFVVNQIDLTGKTVLDIASGEGYGSNILAKYALKVFGVDLSGEAIEHARDKYHASNLFFIQGNVLDIPLENRSIDVVVSFETIEHLDKHLEMIEEIKLKLKTDGVLFISSPNKLYYSDISNTKNEFHIQELYSQQFNFLIQEKFKYSIFFTQNIILGSIITADNYFAHYKKPVLVDKHGDVAEMKSIYNIAIASDSSNLNVNYPILGYSEYDENAYFHNTESKYWFWKGQQKVRSSITYRIGYFVVNPIRIITKKMGRIGRITLASIKKLKIFLI